jgi:diaminopimelate decarboxylase
MGGGVGIRYQHETPPAMAAYAEVILDAVRPTGLDLVIEPGRVLVGNTGVLVTRVIGVKRTPARHFVVLDAAMNDLMRPTLYDSYHEISPVREQPGGGASASVVCDFVGPICESSDVLGRERETVLPQAGDLFMIRGCGAYAATMATQYNSRPRSAEVLVEGDRYRVVKPREQLASLWETELAGLRGGSGG